MWESLIHFSVYTILYMKTSFSFKFFLYSCKVLRLRKFNLLVYKVKNAKNSSGNPDLAIISSQIST